MPISLQDLNENLKTLPEELYGEVNDVVDLLKGKEEIPEWQKEIVRERLKKFRENPQNFVSESEMETYLDKLENEE